jgi:2'-5' RNA ligase superfamily
MVHSIELLFDRDTEAAIRRIWDDLVAADIPSKAPAGRPHVTLAVADRIAGDVDALLRPVAAQLPAPCTVGASLLLGRTNAILARLIVPTTRLLEIHAQVIRICGDHLDPAPAPHTSPGHWTAHVTLARRVDGAALSKALQIAARPSQIDGHFAGLRRWDGAERVEYPIS